MYTSSTTLPNTWKHTKCWGDDCKSHYDFAWLLMCKLIWTVTNAFLWLAHLLSITLPQSAGLTGAPVIAIAIQRPQNQTKSFLIWLLHHTESFMLQQKGGGQHSENNRQKVKEKKITRGPTNSHNRIVWHVHLNFVYASQMIHVGIFFRL